MDVEKDSLTRSCCPSSSHRDLSNGIGENRHILCGNCFSHWYKGRYWNAKEWEEWVSGYDYSDNTSIKES
tara:strand:+ start:384 stop:593 length:210 start_codon:yes stop_codon:yes gene_type:complete